MRTLSLSLFLASLLASCAKWQPLDSPVHPVLAEFPIDMVKSIERGKPDTGGFAQPSYRIDSETRLLLKWSGFLRRLQEIDIVGGRQLAFVIWLEKPVDKGVLDTLRLCPMTRPWMMRASWEAAHPYGADGKWNRAGGDFDEKHCVSPQAQRVRPPLDTDVRQIAFDVRQWAFDYPRGRGVNDGLILIAENPIQWVGESSSSESPRFILYTPVKR